MFPFLIVGVVMNGFVLVSLLSSPLSVLPVSAGAFTAIFIWGKPRAVTGAFTCAIALIPLGLCPSILEKELPP